MIFKSGHIIDFIVILASLVVVYASIKRAETKLPNIRKIPALDALDEAVGRAAETGRPIVFTQGSGGTGAISDPEQGPQITAGLSCLSHLAERTAQLGPRLICCVGQSDAYIPTTEIVREAYIGAGVPEDFKTEDVRFLGSGNAYAFATVDVIRTEKAAATVIIGPFYNESLTFLFHSSDVGALMIGGTAHTHQLPFFAAVCDYTMIGEEIYAASAYLSKLPSEAGSLVGEDLMKGATAALIIIAILAATIGATAFLDLMQI